MGIKREKISGAGLDVFEEEPLPKDHPLRYMDNVIITPHIAGIFPGYLSRANKIFLHNLDAYLNNNGEMINIKYGNGVLIPHFL